MKPEEKVAKMQKLYALAQSSANAPQPKSGLLGWKCPKCNSRIKKESINDWIFSGEGGSEFNKKVIADAGLPEGAYDFIIDYFKCAKCGYEVTKARVDNIKEDTA